MCFLVAGGLVFTFGDRVLGIPSEFTLMLGGLGLIFAAIQNPEGIAGAVRHAGALLRAKRAAASPPPDVGSSSPQPATASVGGH